MFLFNKIPSITGAELQQLGSKATILDVREPNEFEAGHIPGSKNIPLGIIQTYKGKGPVHVICQSGMRSKNAATRLKKMDIEAINVKGGMMMWQGPIKTGKK
ncbi:rhodanese-like domain-containing protein [Vagococcus fessus]|uniref:Sulfurtransferase n=1 Tax=Vagococcus fessus TaxID=120370 RepID=A0A430A4H7_9ENTE|nr:rhodanese-like domain-containing protein [Vagococcus fessus]RSU01638.1 sulfurtransferase [Vagococcus fessus]